MAEQKSELVVRWIGRFFLLGVFIAQAAVFAHYPSYYLPNKLCNLIILLVLPVIAVWIYVIKKKEKQLNWQWLIWLFYLALLIPMVCFLARSEFTKKLDKDHFFGPNVLKITYCGAPVVAVLLLVTAKDAQRYEGSVAQLCGSIALDLFDELELLEILLHQDHPVRLSTTIEVFIILFVCISFCLTTLEMAENKFDGNDSMELRSNKFYRRRLALQIFLVNFPLLVIRLVVRYEYMIDASVFTVKNFIIIVTSILEIIRVWGKD